MNEREKYRKAMQDGLDAQKTQKDRNVLGQFSTPFPLALDMMKYMRTLTVTPHRSLNQLSALVFSIPPIVKFSRIRIVESLDSK